MVVRYTLHSARTSVSVWLLKERFFLFWSLKHHFFSSYSLSAVLPPPEGQAFPGAARALLLRGDCPRPRVPAQLGRPLPRLEGELLRRLCVTAALYVYVPCVSNSVHMRVRVRGRAREK